MSQEREHHHHHDHGDDVESKGGRGVSAVASAQLCG